MIGHMVYFTLHDNAPAKVREMVAACEKYLSKHPGEVFFAAGARATAFTREVNVLDWDVALHIVFRTTADHDAYQDASRHLQFIEENKANWKQVRVFDSEVGVVTR
jgi:Stress responsive A/B Barrel Domain